MSRTAVVFTHEENEGPGLLAPALEGAGFALTVRFREVRAGDAEAALVVVMGGEMAVYQASRYDFLRRELELLRARGVQRRPVIGICLGSQLLAAAAGARVHPGEAGRELGAFPVLPTPDAAADPVFGALTGPLDVAHWHRDTFTPVPGAIPLASSARYAQQAFRLGDSYGLQFHPELDAATFAQWLSAAGEPPLPANDAARLRAAESAWRAVLDRLARHVADRVG